MSRCSPEFKKEALRLLGKSGRSVFSVSEELGIGDWDKIRVDSSRCRSLLSSSFPVRRSFFAVRNASLLSCPCNIMRVKQPIWRVRQVSMKSQATARSRVLLKRTEVFEDADAERLFEEAMADVKRLEPPKTAPRLNGWKRSKESPATGSETDELLNEFLQSESAFDWSLHPDYQEGGPEQRNRKLIRKLRSGRFSVQATLDLHGLSQKEAEIELDAFLAECVSQNLRCARIVHGKGNNSKNQDGVLRKSVPKWLSTKRRGRLIIAFTSAPPQDGGIGATYVLLRKQPLPRNRSKQHPTS